MALFEKVQRLKSEYHQELIQFYEQGPFPIEVRNLFAQHIEDTLWYVLMSAFNYLMAYFFPP